MVTITEAGLLGVHKRRRSRISKCTLSEVLYASTLRFQMMRYTDEENIESFYAQTPAATAMWSASILVQIDAIVGRPLKATWLPAQEIRPRHRSRSRCYPLPFSRNF